MQTFKNAKETLEALEEELRRGRKEASFWKSAYVPTRLVVALYRLAEAQTALLLEVGSILEEFESWEKFEAARTVIAEDSPLGIWIQTQEKELA